MLFTGGITSPIAENLCKTRLNFGKERIVHKIFIVEDDPVIARLVAEQLERWGYEAVCARDFAHVLEEFVAAAPQLVLLDIRLPSYSGYHWCSQIRRVSRVPVIFLSSAADNLNQVMALSLGADDFFSAGPGFESLRVHQNKDGSALKNDCRLLLFVQILWR